MSLESAFAGKKCQFGEGVSFSGVSCSRIADGDYCPRHAALVDYHGDENTAIKTEREEDDFDEDLEDEDEE